MKRYLALICALLMILSLAACGGEKSTGDEPVKLTFWANTWIAAEQEAQKAVIDQWNAEHPDIQVELVLVDWPSVSERLLTAFETGDTPDIFHFDQTDIADWQDLGYLADLSKMLTEEERADVNEDVWAGLSNANGEILGLPIQYETQVLYYNVDMFAAAGIEPPTVEDPWSFEELCDAARRLTDPAAGVYGMSLPALQRFGRCYAEAWAPMIGDQLVYTDAEGNYSFQVSDDGLAVIGELKALLDEGVISPAALAANSDYIGEFVQGKYAMVVSNGCFDRSNFINGAQGIDNAVSWGVAPPIKMQSSDVYGFIQTLSVCENSEHKDEAFEFLHYYWNAENTMKIAKAAYIMPGRNSSVASEELNTEVDDWDLCQQLAAANNVVPAYTWIPGWGQITNVRGNSIWGDYFAGNITLEDAGAQWAKEANALFAQYAED